MTREWHELWFYVAAALLWCCVHELTVSVCVWVCDCVLSVSSYRCVCVAWAGRVLYSWGILRLMRGPRDSFSLLKFLSNSRWYSFWSWPIRVLFFLRASSHLRDKNNKRAHSRLGAFFFFYELRVSHRVCHHLLVKSLKQRRSLLWWRNSFGSSGMSERKTCATSRGPCEGEKKPVIYLLRNVCLCLNTIPDLAAQIGWDSYSRGRFTTASGVLVTEIARIYINKPWCPIWILASVFFRCVFASAFKNDPILIIGIYSFLICAYAQSIPRHN